jgi:hypothetical protein
MPEPEIDKVQIPIMWVLDEFENVNNQAFLRVKDGATHENKEIKAKSRLAKYRYDCDRLGKKGADAPRSNGLEEVY